MNSIPQQDRLKAKASPVVARRASGPDTRFLITAGIAGGLGITAIVAIVMLFHRLPERTIAPAPAPAPAATPVAPPVPPAAPMMVSTGIPVEVKPAVPRVTRVKRTAAVVFRGTVSPPQEEVPGVKAEVPVETAEKNEPAADEVKEVDQKAETAPEPKEAAAEDAAEVRQAGKFKRVFGSLLHPFQRHKPAAEQ